MKLKYLIIIVMLFFTVLINADVFQRNEIQIYLLQPFNQTNYNLFLSNETNEFNLSIENFSPIDYNVTIISEVNFTNDSFIILGSSNNTIPLDYSIIENINASLEVKI